MVLLVKRFHKRRALKNDGGQRWTPNDGNTPGELKHDILLDLNTSKLRTSILGCHNVLNSHCVIDRYQTSGRNDIQGLYSLR